jgi:hypothetical protein
MLKHRSHPRLLQHNLAEPDAIRIARRAPRKVAAMQVIPPQKCAPKTAQIFAARRKRSRSSLYENSRQSAHYGCGLTLCAITIHPFFCSCHTLIMRCGVDGSACEPAVPFKVMV